MAFVRAAPAALVRRRVKEQQKQVFKSEFRNTHFSFTLGADGTEQFVSKPELHSDEAIESDPLPPGQVWGVKCGAMLGKNTRGGTVVAGALNLGGSIELVPNAVRIAELAGHRASGDLAVSLPRQLVILFVGMRAPIAAYGLVVLVGWRGPCVTVLTFLCLPIATDPDVFGATTILFTGLV